MSTEAFLLVFFWLGLSTLNAGVLFIWLKHANPARYHQQTDGQGYLGIVGKVSIGCVPLYDSVSRLAKDTSGAISPGLRRYARFSRSLFSFLLLWLLLCFVGGFLYPFVFR